MTDRNSWATPQTVYDVMNNEFNFTMDICANDYNFKHVNYLTIKDDALTYNFDQPELVGNYVWCNPPYSKVMPWVELAVKNQALGIGTVMLVKNDCSTKWYMLALERAQEIRDVVGGRLSFVPPHGIKASSNNFTSCFLIFKPHGVEQANKTYVDIRALR